MNSESELDDDRGGGGGGGALFQGILCDFLFSMSGKQRRYSVKEVNSILD
jgi:hypothetical protein